VSSSPSKSVDGREGGRVGGKSRKKSWTCRAQTHTRVREGGRRGRRKGGSRLTSGAATAAGT
jgi:hypothetical protein